MKRIIASLLATGLVLGVAPAARAEVAPNAQCYKVGSVKESEYGTVECVLSRPGLARWQLVDSASTRAGAIKMLNTWWVSFVPENRASTCKRFGNYPTKFRWEVAKAFPQFPTPVMLWASKKVFTAKCD